MGHVPTRLLVAGWVAAMVLAVLATAAVAAQGAQGPGLPRSDALPALTRVPAPHPMPANVVKFVEDTWKQIKASDNTALWTGN